MGRPGIFTPRVLFAVLAAPLALAGCSSMSTYGTGEAPELALMRELTGGLVGEDKQPIDYQPRAPLVMPPAQGGLPPPVATASAANNPDWPVDPGAPIVASAAQLDDDPRNDVSPEEYRRLRPLSGVFAAAGQTGNEFLTGKDEYYQNIVHGKEQRDAFRTAVANSKGYGRMERRYLTDPPLTYREPATSAPQAYEEAKTEKKKWWWPFGGGGPKEQSSVAVPVGDRQPSGAL